MACSSWRVIYLTAGVSMGLGFLMRSLSWQLFLKGVVILAKQKLQECLPLLLIEHTLFVYQVPDECALNGRLSPGNFRALGFDDLEVGLGSEDGADHFFTVHLNFPLAVCQFLFVAFTPFLPYPAFFIGKVKVVE